jgi:hypothetical protein
MDMDAPIPLSYVSKPIRRKLAKHLDTGTQNNWEELAEQLHLEPASINWISACSNPNGYTSTVFDLCSERNTVPELIAGLRAINNLAALDVIYKHYDGIKAQYDSDVSMTTTRRLVVAVLPWRGSSLPSTI